MFKFCCNISCCFRLKNLDTCCFFVFQKFSWLCHFGVIFHMSSLTQLHLWGTCFLRLLNKQNNFVLNLPLKVAVFLCVLQGLCVQVAVESCCVSLCPSILGVVLTSRLTVFSWFVIGLMGCSLFYNFV